MRLSRLSELPIKAPNYDRGSVTVGIAHIGAGHFHRAHQAMYIDRLLQAGSGAEWGICGVGVMPADWTMRDVLNDQDGLYTLILENPDGSRDAQVIGSIIDYRYAPDDPESALEAPGRTVHPDHFADHHRGRIPRPRRARVRVDRRGFGPASPPRNPPHRPSCRATTSRTTARSHDVPSSRTAESRRPGTRRVGGANTFSSLVRWSTASPRPRLWRWPRKCGATSVSTTGGRWWPSHSPPGCSKTTSPTAGRRWSRRACCWSTMSRPYELMKLRLLNAGHQCLAYFAHLCGFEFVHEAAQRSVVRRILACLFRIRGHPDAAAGARDRPA